ncbi:MAG: hypothetical protein AVDCRST_MAG50-189, partial [uncultured Acidimicrobiales bacterium]
AHPGGGPGLRGRARHRAAALEQLGRLRGTHGDQPVDRRRRGRGAAQRPCSGRAVHRQGRRPGRLRPRAGSHRHGRRLAPRRAARLPAAEAGRVLVRQRPDPRVRPVPVGDPRRGRAARIAAVHGDPQL